MRHLLLLLLAAGLLAAPAHAQTAEPPALAVLDVELVDDHLNPATVVDQQRRLAEAGEQLRRELAATGAYRVVDLAPAAALVERLRGQHEYLYRCDDCADQVGRALGTRLVMSAWVQKVSELILNVNLQVRDVDSGRLVLTKSADMRGNRDESWRRAVHFLVRDLAERRARDPAYGR
ncbi:hypothetical protein IWX58_002902 [Rubrivivax gelatinosus]|uniref:DUF3280 domain-containing protein n=2 Tax=Rubrivivax gelatinosus TaxID=28068 RepID=UPI0018CA6F85|nr:DUF3280 domain-containing protein [Rubrivivax gelatinosus]MBG6081215.1 hypothetical protein [Rubrivivax gelatinosus]